MLITAVMVLLPMCGPMFEVQLAGEANYLDVWTEECRCLLTVGVGCSRSSCF